MAGGQGLVDVTNPGFHTSLSDVSSPRNGPGSADVSNPGFQTSHTDVSSPRNGSEPAPEKGPRPVDAREPGGFGGDLGYRARLMFRLMTVNLLHDRCDVAGFSRLLERLDPDVVVTQELGPTCADILGSAYPHHRLRPALDFTGRGIATRLPVSFGDVDMPGRPGTSATLELDSGVVRMAGVHLLNPINFPWWASVKDRGRQLERLFAWLEEDIETPVVVAGDFNASPRWPAYRRTAARLADLVAERAARAGVQPERTWSWRPGWPRLLRIDHVFGRDVKATHVEVHTIRGTDHAPVVVDLELLSRAPR